MRLDFRDDVRLKLGDLPTESPSGLGCILADDVDLLGHLNPFLSKVSRRIVKKIFTDLP
jgi:hypothetical protein